MGTSLDPNGRAPLYAHRALGQVGHGLSGPFVPYQAAYLGATTAELGWLLAFANLFPNVLQPLWGRFSDRAGRRVPFVVVGTLVSSSLYLLLAASTSVWQLIVLVLVQAVATSMVVPTWGALLGERTGLRERGRVFGAVSLVASAASLAGTILAGLIIFGGNEADTDAFRLPFLLAVPLGIGSALVLLATRETPNPVSPPVEVDAADPLAEERRSDFRFFVRSQALYNFFQSLSWPLIPITIIVVLGASHLDVVLLAVLTMVSTIALQSQVGRLLDRVGPTVLIQASRFLFVAIPLAYAFAGDLWVIYGIYAVLGVPTAIVNVAFSGYIMNLSSPERHAAYFGVFNGVTGVATFAGTLVGGYLATLLAVGLSLTTALLIVYFLSFAGRMAGALLTMRVRDPTEYPETFGQVWRRFERYFADGRR